MSFRSIEDIRRACEESGREVWEAILLHDAKSQDITAEESRARMANVWARMRQSVEDYDGARRSRSALVGGAGEAMMDYAQGGGSLSGPFVSRVIARSLMLGESNACMRCIVAAPTAGACGVLPAVLYSCAEEGYPEEEILHALYVAAAFGEIIAQRAFLSGAAGGCQAEIGSASGMAAAALTALRGGTLEQMGHACAMALKNLLGLVCDPVAGLVEVPCVKRNVVGAVNALAAADMALAGISSAIPVDQVIDAMREVGEAMDPSLRETARGGLAATPTGLSVAEALRESRT